MKTSAADVSATETSARGDEERDSWSAGEDHECKGEVGERSGKHPYTLHDFSER
jgi:hypothetical protein